MLILLLLKFNILSEIMKLNLRKPIVFFDLEATGLNPVHDRIVEISALKINVDGQEEQRTWLVNPGCPIPPETTAIHHISDDDVKDCPSFKELAPAIVKFFGSSDIAGYNIIKFDVPMLMEELIRANEADKFKLESRQIIDVMNIFMKMEPRTLKGAYRFFMNKELEDAHSASADTMATYEVMMAMLDKYKDREYTDGKGVTSVPVQNDMQQLSVFSSHNKNADLLGQIVYDEDGKEVKGVNNTKTLKNASNGNSIITKPSANTSFPIKDRLLIFSKTDDSKYKHLKYLVISNSKWL